MSEFNFTVDHNEAQEFGRLPDGEYEVFITGAKVSNPSSNGNLGVQMVMTVRDDVDQTGKGRKVWDTMWVTPNTKGLIQGRLKAMQIPSGTAFDSLQDMADAVKGLPVRIRVKGQADNDDFNEVSAYLQARHEGFYDVEEDTNVANTPTDISDDDLPF